MEYPEHLVEDRRNGYFILIGHDTHSTYEHPQIGIHYVEDTHLVLLMLAGWDVYFVLRHVKIEHLSIFAVVFPHFGRCKTKSLRVVLILFETYYLVLPLLQNVRETTECLDVVSLHLLPEFFIVVYDGARNFFNLIIL